jgi:SAM-dependent methyltransferase
VSDSLAWQLKIFDKTLKKKEKLAIILDLLPKQDHHRCLDLGCAKGTISYFLKKSGGVWFHEDLDFSNVKTTSDLVGLKVAVISPMGIPHPSNTFDVIVSLDILEHIENDEYFAGEMARVLKPGGVMILSTPATGPFYLVNRLKTIVGLTPDQYGHVVEGYTLTKLDAMLSNAGFKVDQATTYSRFFTEFVEFLINFVFVTFLRRKSTQKRDGHISPGSAEEVASLRKQLTFYSAVYPLIWLFTRLDILWKWLRIPGYATLLVCRKL